MAVNKSVCDIFQAMDLTDKTVCTKEGREWLKNYSKSELYCGHTSSIQKNMDDMEPLMWRRIVEKIVLAMKMNSDFLIQLLNETVYNSKDSKEIVTTFCKDLYYYMDLADDCVFYANGEGVVDLCVTVRDMYILGRVLAPLLIAGYIMRIHLLDEIFLPYLVAIGDVITSVGVPKGTKYLFISPDVNEPEDPTRLLIRGDSSFHYCPLVIFEESDFDSAIDNLIETNRSFNGLLYWSVTHVYIQESVFSNVVSKMKHLSVSWPDIKLLAVEQKDQLKSKETSGIIKFCIDWDPRDLEVDRNLTMFVSVLPFRTLDEVVTIVNSENTGCAASLWTDKLSIANRASRLLKLSTVWINSHGLVDPMVPLESFNETRLPLNGIQLLEYITSLKKLMTDFSFESNSNDSTLSVIKEKEKYFSKSFEDAVDVSSSGYEALKKINDQRLKELLKFNNKRTGYKRVSPLDTIYHSSPKMDVLCFSGSYKVVMLIFTNETLPLEFLEQVWFYLIATRNAVIVCASSSLLKSIANILPSTLPQGVITLLDMKLYRRHNSCAKRIGKTFLLNIADSKDIPKNTVCTCSDFLRSFVSKKVLWMPTD